MEYKCEHEYTMIRNRLSRKNESNIIIRDVAQQPMQEIQYLSVQQCQSVESEYICRKSPISL